MGIRDRIKSKARQAIRRATGERSQRPEPSNPVKAWKPYEPTGPEGHEAMEEVQDVISFADTAAKKNDASAGEVPEHVVEALSDTGSGAASNKVDTNRLTPHEGEAGEIQHLASLGKQIPNYDSPAYAKRLCPQSDSVKKRMEYVAENIGVSYKAMLAIALVETGGCNRRRKDYIQRFERH